MKVRKLKALGDEMLHLTRSSMHGFKTVIGEVLEAFTSGFRLFTREQVAWLNTPSINNFT